MTIKEFAHAAQRDLQSVTGVTFKRGHIYELLAAAFGFGSYAALCRDHVFDVGDHARALRPDPGAASVERRAQELYYARAVAHGGAATLIVALKDRELVVRNLDRLLATTRRERSLNSGIKLPDLDDDDSDEYWMHDEEEQSLILLDSLSAAAMRGDHRAHYALALLDDPRSDDSFAEGSAHWHSVQQSGVVLSGVEKEWADAYAVQQGRSKSNAFHLEKACRLGNPYALLDLAEQLDDPRYFDVAAAQAVIAEPRRMARLAARFGRGDVVQWLTAAAEAGDIDAMRDLIEGLDADDLQRCWMWIHFARMLGKDLLKSNLRAYHEGGINDGQAYDDDVGGPMYVGGDEGIQLESLADEADQHAVRAAQELFDRLPSRPALSGRGR